MQTLMPFLVGILYAAGVFLILQKNLIKMAIGLVLLTNATNLFLFAAGRLTKAIPPLIPMDQKTMDGDFANPVSEALILTAIVIGFGLLSFVLALIYNASTKFKSFDINEIGQADE